MVMYGFGVDTSHGQLQAAQQQENSLEALTTAMMDAKAKEDEAERTAPLLAGVGGSEAPQPEPEPELAQLGAE